MRVAVTGSTGRLGRAVVQLVAEGGWLPFSWTRAELDLDHPGSVGAALDRDRPDIVVHCAAWTNVDGCAREPEVAEQRNGHATGTLAERCAERGIGLVAVSTNEVFDGTRQDGQPYRTTDEPKPGNPYGRSKWLGEQLARAAFGRHAGAPLWVTRTAWLFGPPGADFPLKIVEAARTAAREQQPLRLVADEVGCPTYARDVAAAICDLVGDRGSEGTLHVVNAGRASRAQWAREVLDLAQIVVDTEDVSMDTWPRPSKPPRWGVLEPTALPTLGLLRPWEAALEMDLGMRLAGNG